VINTENGFKAEGRRQKAEVRRRKKEGRRKEEGRKKEGRSSIMYLLQTSDFKLIKK